MNERQGHDGGGEPFHPAISPEAQGAPESQSLEELDAAIADIRSRTPNAEHMLRRLVGEDMFNGLQYDYSAGDKYESFGDYMARYVDQYHPDQADDVRQVLEEKDRLDRERTQLERLARPKVRAETRRLLDEMADTTDWGRAMDDPAMTPAIPLLYQDGVPEWFYYSEGAHTLNKLRECASEYALPEGAGTPEEARDLSEIHPREWLATTDRATKMLSARRRHEVLGRLVALRKLVTIVDPNKPTAHPTPAGMQQAVVAKFEAATVEFDAADEAAVKKAHAEDLTRPLFVGGATHLGERIGRNDATDWVQERLDKLPATWTAGISTIQFVDDLGDMTIGENLEQKAGQHLGDENRLAVRIEDGPDPEVNRHLMAEVLYHEAMHRAHRKRMSIATLRRWIEVTDLEHVYLTPYISRSRNDPGRVESGQADCEDLADSATLFMISPGEVVVNSTRRFEYLNQLTGRYELPVPIHEFTRDQGYDPGSLTRALLDKAGDLEMIPGPEG